MKKENIFYAFLFGIVAYVLAENFFIAMSNPNYALGFLLVAFALILILVTGVYDLGFLVGFVLTVAFLAIFAGPYSVASCLNESRERIIKAALENPKRENWETFLNADNSLWDVEPSELKFCRMRSDLGSQIKPYLGFE